MSKIRLGLIKKIFLSLMIFLFVGIVLKTQIAYAANYTPKGPIPVPRIAQTHANDCNICSLASIQAFALGQYSYTPTANSDPVNGRPEYKGVLLSRTYDAPGEYSQNDDPIWWKLYIAYGCDNAPRYSSSLYPAPMTFVTGGVSISNALDIAYTQLSRGVPVHIYTGSHASIIIGYRGNTDTLKTEDFTVMEIKPYGNGWQNSASYFNLYAANPSTYYSSSVSHCYVTLSAWLNSNGGKISVISYPTNGASVIQRKKIDIIMDNGQVTGVQSGDYIEVGAQVSLTATPLSGFTFTGWTITSGNVITENSNNPYTFTMPENDLTIEANFKLISNTVVKRWKNVSANTSGSSLSMSATLEIDAATVLNLEMPHTVTNPRVLVSTSQALRNALCRQSQHQA